MRDGANRRFSRPPAPTVAEFFGSGFSYGPRVQGIGSWNWRPYVRIFIPQAVIQLHNTGYDELQAYRIDAEGNRVIEAEVGLGQHPRVLWTFVGENWVVTDSQGECVSVHRATEDAGTVTVY